MAERTDDPVSAPAPPALAPWRGVLLPCVVVVAACAPFLDRAFHVDDPLFLWAAQQIVEAPLDPYGFEVNWYGWAMPMAEVTKNPPLACYLAAGAGALVGWSERALHAAFLAPLLAAVLGIFALARRLTAWPVMATLAAVLTPAFLVSGASVMCDTTMLAFWVWSLALWDRGLTEERPASLWAAAGLAALGALTKYFAVALLPLLLVWALARRASVRRWALPLLLPVLVLLAYQLVTASLYGRGLLLDAAAYATDRQPQDAGALAGQLLAGLAFTGGCVASALFLGPVVLRRGQLWIPIVVAAVLAGVLIAGAGPELPGDRASTLSAGALAQVALWSAVGVGVLLLAIHDLRVTREPAALLLLLWVGGTLVFASWVNWTVNGRSVLPLVPAVGILLARAGERWGARERPVALALSAAGALAFAVTWADGRLADSARDAARELVEYQGLVGSHGEEPGRLTFQGHWGFQHYAQEAGLAPLALDRDRLEPGDRVVLPGNNTNVHPLPDTHGAVVGTLRMPVPSFLSTLSREAGAGFHSSTWGPLPFAFGAVEDELYEVWEVSRALQLRRR
jgi:4-amino-4-deoxy-L-arabinose transferase-like glycosyltransferase